jgi:hypothetical protein
VSGSAVRPNREAETRRRLGRKAERDGGFGEAETRRIARSAIL